MEYIMYSMENIFIYVFSTTNGSGRKRYKNPFFCTPSYIVEMQFDGNP